MCMVYAAATPVDLLVSNWKAGLLVNSRNHFGGPA
jgi:hypothetical protein